MKSIKNIFSHEPVFSDRLVSSYEELKEIVDGLRLLGFRIVLTSGSFDLIHIGHARYIQKAKEFGDLLVVGVDSDAKIQKRKGPRRPVIPEKERLEMLSHLRGVDLIFLKQEYDEQWSLVKAVRPDVLIVVEGTYEDSQIGKLSEFCGEVQVLGRQAETSTSARVRLFNIHGAEDFKKKFTLKLDKIIQESFDAVKKSEQ